ncbi:Zinc finger C2H2-type [Sesbania bispinosa]|nr:Zinc finger C2H2-type [Sesbania bispinosa]
MDSEDQKVKLDDELHQDDDNREGSDSEKPLKKIEKLNSSPSEFCKASDKLKGDEEDISTSKKAASSSGVHPCEFCDKVFSSGKALGGHKRLHIQAQRKEAHNNNNNEMKSCDNKLIKCCVCMKDFPSEKSLHGHLRSHPERFWRGVHPPEPSSQNQNSNYSMEENNDEHGNGGQILNATMEAAIDISKYLPLSWKKTDKRGRACTYSKEDINAAQILMFMSRDNKKRSHSMVNPKLSLHHNLNENGDECDKNNGEKSMKDELFVGGNWKCVSILPPKLSSPSSTLLSKGACLLIERPRIETPSPLPTFKVRKEKLGD